MNKIYNPELKERFLSTYDNEDTRSTLRHVFYKSYLVENVLDKDLSQFNLDEIGKCIANSSPHNAQTARSIGRFISAYISWAIEEGLREGSNIDPIKGINSNWYDSFVDKSKKIHYSKEELINLCEQLPNSQDQAFLMLIFEGMLGAKFDELRELSYNDIDWNNNKITIRCRDNYVIEVDDVTMRYLERAYKATTYNTYNEKTGEHSERELLPNNYIFKNVKSPRGKEGEPVTQAVFYTRLKNIKTEFDLEYLTPNSIRQSGIQWMSVQLYKEKQDKLEYEDFEKIGKRYDFSMLTNNGYTYYNTTLLKEIIQKSTIKELYDIEIEY